MQLRYDIMHGFSASFKKKMQINNQKNIGWGTINNVIGLPFYV